MTKDQYDALDYKEKIFADLLLEIRDSLKKLEHDISADIERTLS